MSNFISVEGFTEEPKQLITLNQVQLHWGKLPHLPKSEAGKNEILKLMSTLERKERYKVQALTEQLITKQYNNLKKNMLKFARKPETNFFSPPPQLSLSLQTSPRVDLQQKYGHIVYPQLMAIKEAEEVVLSKRTKREASISCPGVNVRRINHLLRSLTKNKSVDPRQNSQELCKENRRSENSYKVDRQKQQCHISWVGKQEQKEPRKAVRSNKTMRRRNVKPRYSKIRKEAHDGGRFLY